MADESTKNPLDSYHAQRLRYLETHVDSVLKTIYDDYDDEVVGHPEESDDDRAGRAITFLLRRLAMLFTLSEFHADRSFLQGTFGRYKEEEEQ